MAPGGEDLLKFRGQRGIGIAIKESAGRGLVAGVKAGGDAGAKRCKVAGQGLEVLGAADGEGCW